MEIRQLVLSLVEQQREGLTDLSLKIHAHPELAFEEVSASRWLAEYLASYRHEVERPFSELPTAIVAKAGTGSLRVALCAEYDALPERGHACGHNLIAATAAGAGAALAQLADDLDLTVLVIGTPGEELYSHLAVPDDARGPGKALLLERGAFEGVHLALMAHPAPIDVAAAPTKAVARLHASFRLSGPAGGPPLIDPADLRRLEESLAIAQASVASLAKRAPPSARISTVGTKGCWSMHLSADADVGFFAATIQDLEGVKQELRRCFEAAAEATGSGLEIVEHLPCAEMRPDAALVAAYRANAETLGRAFPDVGSILDRMTFATDMGNVSHRVPAIHPFFGIGATVLNHHPQFTDFAATNVAHHAMVDSATALAWTVLDAATQLELRSRLLRPRSR